MFLGLMEAIIMVYCSMSTNIKTHSEICVSVIDEHTCLYRGVGAGATSCPTFWPIVGRKKRLSDWVAHLLVPRLL